MKDPNRRRYPVADRLVEVIDDRQTGETILDEALKMMKAQESGRMGINSWIDLLSGEFVLLVPAFLFFPYPMGCVSRMRFLTRLVTCVLSFHLSSIAETQYRS